MNSMDIASLMILGKCLGMFDGNGAPAASAFMGALAGGAFGGAMNGGLPPPPNPYGGVYGMPSANCMGGWPFGCGFPSLF